jgi:hypothetical protein
MDEYVHGSESSVNPSLCLAKVPVIEEIGFASYLPLMLKRQEEKERLTRQ